MQSNFYEFPVQSSQAPIVYRDFITELEGKMGVDTARKIAELNAEAAAAEAAETVEAEGESKTESKADE